MKKEEIEMKYTTEFKIGLLNWIMSSFSWSNWVDIDTFSFGYSAYLLQGKKNRRTNAKKFRVVPTNHIGKTANIGHLKFERLEERGLIETETKYPTK